MSGKRLTFGSEAVVGHQVSWVDDNHNVIERPTFAIPIGEADSDEIAGAMMMDVQGGRLDNLELQARVYRCEH